MKLILVFIAGLLINACSSSESIGQKHELITSSINTEVLEPISISIAEHNDRQILKAALFENYFVLLVERQTDSAETGIKNPEPEIFCVRNEDFNQGVSVYIANEFVVAGGTRQENVNHNDCPDNLTLAFLDGLLPLEQVPALKTGLLIPELQTVIYGTGNYSANVSCDCEALKQIESKPKALYYLNKSYFYLELEEGQWFKFSQGEKRLFIDSLKAVLSSEADFIKASESAKYAIQNTLFETLDMSLQSFLFIRLPHSKDYLYVYTFPTSRVFSDPIYRLLFIH